VLKIFSVLVLVFLPSLSQSASSLAEPRIAVELHLGYLQKGEYTAAFAQLGKETQLSIGDTDSFESIITKQYPTLHSHRIAFVSEGERFSFDRVIVLAQVIDQEGFVWITIFQVENNAGEWRIISCEILKTSRVSV